MEKEIATHSRIFAWEITQTEEHGGLQSMGFQQNQTRLSDFTFTFSSFIVHTHHPGTIQQVGWGLRFCISSRLLGDVDKAGPLNTLKAKI